MTSRKCYKEHYWKTEQLCQYGKDIFFGMFTFVYTNFYCYECNKTRRILSVYFNKPKIFYKSNKNNDLPF